MVRDRPQSLCGGMDERPADLETCANGSNSMP